MRWYRSVFVMLGGDEEGEWTLGYLVTAQRPHSDDHAEGKPMGQARKAEVRARIEQEAH